MAVEFGHAGVLNEGELELAFWHAVGDSALTKTADGIHIDMDRLKRGEVK